MSTVKEEIAALEEQLRLAELGPDPRFFEEALADEMVMAVAGSKPAFAKAQVLEAHQPGQAPKFTRVEMRDMVIHDHGTAAVVTCQGIYEGPEASVTLQFMRVWVKKSGRWQIVAGSVAQ